MNNIDNRQELSIWRYLKYYDSDLLVQEYVKLLLKIKVKPGIIDKVDLASIEVPNYNLSVDNQVECLNNFFHYFQCRNFARNIKNATDNEVCVANPLYRLMIPQFQTLPLGAHKEFTLIKQNFGLAIQTAALQAIAFNIESYLLKIFNNIFSLVSQNAENPQKRDPDFKYFFLTLYTAARVEFHKTYTIKEIDWSQRVTKAKESLPKWRKESGPVPKTAPNRYAQTLIKKVQEGKKLINASTVLKDFKELTTIKPNFNPEPFNFSQATANPPQQSSNNERKSRNLRQNIKDTKLGRKGRNTIKRNENPAIFRNRQIPASENSSFIDPTKMIK